MVRGHQTVQVPFLGCALSFNNIIPLLSVSYHNGYLRGPLGLCAFCHGDQMAQRPCDRCGGGRIHIVAAEPTSRNLAAWVSTEPMEGLPLRAFDGRTWFFQHVPHGPRCKAVTWIDREFAAHPANVPFESCPCCQGRPS